MPRLTIARLLSASSCIFALTTQVFSIPDPVPLAQALSFEQMNALVLITGDDGNTIGSGFVTALKGVPFVLTNLHLLGANQNPSFRTLGGKRIEIQGWFRAIGDDLAIIRLADASADLPRLTVSLDGSQPGDPVAITGNQGMGSVATQITGQLLGIGPERLEIEAAFTEGYDGSPILNLRTGQVIGITGHTNNYPVLQRDFAAIKYVQINKLKKMEEWFGYRLDLDRRWEQIDLQRWNVQRRRIQEFQSLSEAMLACRRSEYAQARQMPKLKACVDAFQDRKLRLGNNLDAINNAESALLKECMAISAVDEIDFSKIEFYDFYRRGFFFETSILQQQRYRALVVKALGKNAENLAR